MKNEIVLYLGIVLLLAGNIHHEVIKTQADEVLLYIEDTDGKLIASTDTYVRQGDEVLVSLKIPKETDAGDYIKVTQFKTGNHIAHSKEVIHIEEKKTWLQKTWEYIKRFFP